MLTERFYTTYKVQPEPWFHGLSRAVFGVNSRLARTRLRVEGWENLPDRPVLIATNSTQKNDFMAYRWVALQRGRPTVTVTKAKNYHVPVMGFALRRLGVVPIASKGYFLLLDFMKTVGRRPTDAEYRALRDHLDGGVDLPVGEPFETLMSTPRECLGHSFDPATGYRAFHQALYRHALGHTLRLSRAAVEAGHDVQMYPEGTVAPRLGKGRAGAVQLAWALGLDIVPVGMSGCPQAFVGDSPLLRLRGGDVTLRMGAPIRLPRDLLPPDYEPFDPVYEAAHKPALQGFVDDALMPAIDRLLDAPFQSLPGDTFVGKGTRAFL